MRVWPLPFILVNSNLFSSLPQLQIHIRVKKERDQPLHPNRRRTIIIGIDASGYGGQDAQHMKMNPLWDYDRDEKKSCGEPADRFNKKGHRSPLVPRESAQF